MLVFHCHFLRDKTQDAGGRPWDDKMDWSLIRTGHWTVKYTKGVVPGSLFSFASGHHNGSVYIIGGQRGEEPYGPTSDVFALDLSSLIWRKVRLQVSDSSP